MHVFVRFPVLCLCDPIETSIMTLTTYSTNITFLTWNSRSSKIWLKFFFWQHHPIELLTWFYFPILHFLLLLFLLWYLCSRWFFHPEFTLVLIYVYKNLLILKDYHKRLVFHEIFQKALLSSSSVHSRYIYVFYTTYHILPCTTLICMCLIFFLWKQQLCMHETFFLCQFMVCHMLFIVCGRMLKVCTYILYIFTVQNFAHKYAYHTLRLWGKFKCNFACTKFFSF